MKTMTRVLLAAFTCAILVPLAGCGSSPPPPPPPMTEVRPPRPAARAVWVPGHWKWNKHKHRHVWVRGHWKA